MIGQDHYDVIIVGAGAAGLSAGLVLSRAQADILIVDDGKPRNAPAAHMHGFVSRDGISPEEFLAMGRREVIAYDGTILSTSVASIELRDDGAFDVNLTGGTTKSARAVLVATGLTDDLPDIPGLRERWGSSVHHCPYCHGFEVRGQSIAVIGGAIRELSLKQAGLLRRFSDHVTLLTNRIELTPVERQQLNAFGIRVADGTVSHLVGQPGSLEGVALTDGPTIDCDAAFIAPRPLPNDALLRTLGCTIDSSTGFVTTNQDGQTSVPGVWAAGNVVTPTAQVITAAGAASASAIAINGWLLQKDLGLSARPG